MEQNQNTNEQQPEHASDSEVKAISERAESSKINPFTAFSNLKPQTENMEVHKHPHGVTHKKKWTEYLLEFLMIFFAVTMGFFAENIREGTVNREKEKEYMKSMLQDLISDTMMLSRTMDFSARVEVGLDSLSTRLYSGDGTDSSTLEIYRLQGKYSRAIGVSFNDATSIQLRNSGGMQVIKNVQVRYAIANYWRRITVIEDIIDRFNNPLDADFAYSIFNRSYQHIGVDTSTGMSVVSVDLGAHFMTNDKNQLINYANRIRRKASIIDNFMMRNLKDQKKAATDLITLIKKHYHVVE